MHRHLLIGLLEVLLDIGHIFAILAIFIPRWLYFFEYIPLGLLLPLVSAVLDEIEEVEGFRTRLQEWITTSHLFIFESQANCHMVIDG